MYEFQQLELDCSPSAAPQQSEHMNQSDLSQHSYDQTAEEITEHSSDNDKIDSEQDTNMNSVTNDSALDKMSVFKKKEKTLLFAAD